MVLDLKKKKEEHVQNRQNGFRIVHKTLNYVYSVILTPSLFLSRIYTEVAVQCFRRDTHPLSFYHNFYHETLLTSKFYFKTNNIRYFVPNLVYIEYL